MKRLFTILLTGSCFLLWGQDDQILTADELGNELDYPRDTIRFVAPEEWEESGTDAVHREGQIQERPLDEDAWRKLTEDLDYGEEEESSKITPTQRGPRGTQINSGFVQYLLIAVVLLALVFLILRFVSPDLLRREKRQKQRIDTRAVETLDPDELREALRLALDSGDLRLAVRIWYLIIIRELSARRLIRWNIEKTNNQYLAEMGNHALLPEFRKTTKAYERVWFGEETIGPQRYRALENDFNQLVERIAR